MSKFSNFIRNASANDATLKMLAKIYDQGAIIMATVADLQAALATLAADTAAEKVEVVTAIGALKVQLASGTNVSAADLDGLLSQIQGLDASVKDIIQAPVV